MQSKEGRVHESRDEIFKDFKLDAIRTNRRERKPGRGGEREREEGRNLATIFAVLASPGIVPFSPRLLRRRFRASPVVVGNPGNSRRNKYS